MSLHGHWSGKKMKKDERIGIFGGTFDPPHIGHQILGMEAYDQLKLSRLFWVLTPSPPHKQGKAITDINIRIAMVQKAIQDDPIFEFSRVDIDRPGPHFIVDTLKIFRKKYPGSILIFIMGGDSLRDLPTWHEPKEFIDQCDKLGVMHRLGERIDLRNLEKEIPRIKEKIEFIEAPLLEISSNQIRNLVSKGKPYRYYLPLDVYKIVKSHHLYTEGVLFGTDNENS